MVPIYSAASWASTVSLRAAFYLDPLRDIYEAFTLYTFLQLLINFLGGERSLIIMMHGRPPVSHPWPMSLYFSKIDISDPHTFLAIKRGILQYTYFKPFHALLTIILKSTDTYKEGYISVDSGYFWTALVYNVSITISLYCLAMFWVCMVQDLQPFRPMPKFLCIKLIIFASYWQGFFLSILQFLGAIPSDVPGYSADNLAAAIQDALICFEMPVFAVAHWYAFSWHDYADDTISAARMSVTYAFRDAFGIRDLIEDTKFTFKGKNYDYRSFDSGDNVIAHEESHSRVARMMDGMRYERGGKGKYWIPKPQQANARTPLLADDGFHRAPAPESRSHAHDYRAADPDWEIGINAEDERLYTNARALEFGDWNYPVITVHEARREDWMNRDPTILTTSTNRHLIQPTRDNKERRRAEIREGINKGKERSSSSRASSSRRKETGGIEAKLANDLDSHEEEDDKIDTSLLVDLVVEDEEAEAADRVRARMEGGDAWNRTEQKRFVRTYSGEGFHKGTEEREGFDPAKIPAKNPPPEHAVSDEEDEEEGGKKDNHGQSSTAGRYGSLVEDTNVWGR
jgi:Organic solute transporter Ostalpha